MMLTVANAMGVLQLVQMDLYPVTHTIGSTHPMFLLDKTRPRHRPYAQIHIIALLVLLSIALIPFL